MPSTGPLTKGRGAFFNALAPNEAKAMSDNPSDPMEALPALVSVQRTCKVLGLSRPTVWRRVKDGTLQVASGSLGGRTLILKTSIQRFLQPAQVKP